MHGGSNSAPGALCYQQRGSTAYAQPRTWIKRLQELQEDAATAAGLPLLPPKAPGSCYTVPRNNSYKSFTPQKTPVILTRTRYCNLLQLSLWHGCEKATAFGIFLHVIHYQPKLNTAQLRVIDLNHFLSKQEKQACENMSGTAQKMGWAEMPLWLFCTPWHREWLSGAWGIPVSRILTARMKNEWYPTKHSALYSKYPTFYRLAATKRFCTKLCF